MKIPEDKFEEAIEAKKIASEMQRKDVVALLPGRNGRRKEFEFNELESLERIENFLQKEFDLWPEMLKDGFSLAVRARLSLIKLQC